MKAPGFGDRRKDMLKDLAVLTGGTVISEELGMNFESCTLEHLGTAKKITIDKENTTVVDGSGAKKDVQARVSQIKAQIEETTSDYDREKLQERLAKLSGGVAVVRVGAPTETEMKEKKDRVEDSLNATRAAVEEGIVVGGGAALLDASRCLDTFKAENDEQDFGVKIIWRACQEPLRQIAINAGLEGSVVVNEVKTYKGKGNWGYNARENRFEDLQKLELLTQPKWFVQLSKMLLLLQDLC